MAGLSAVIFLPDDTGKTGYTRPMLLGNLMGAPLLAWLVDSLSAGGVERFFLVCRPPWEAAARACFPADTQLVVAEESQASEQIQVFLSAAGDEQSDVIVVTGPCVLLPYDAEILQILDLEQKTKNLVVQVTDPRLLQATGGIVQGMSGCPLLQDGKLAGAVTHVFTEDPTTGYGICAQTMWEESQICSVSK